MRLATLLFLAAAAAAAPAGPAVADDTGNFLYRLGRDTTSVEHYVRTADRLVFDQVGRSPKVLRRHAEYAYANGSLTHFTLAVTPPGGMAATQSAEARLDGDSLRVEMRGAAGAESSAVAFPPGTVLVVGQSPWPSLEGAIERWAPQRTDSLLGTMYFLGGPSTDWLRLRRLGRDSIEVRSGRGDDFRVRIDAAGHVLGVRPIAGTAKFSVERLAHADLAAAASTWAAREQAGGGLGVLSPRDTVNATIGGAALWVDYGRPAKRGRMVFGGIVPWGEVWRTGANAATQFRTDRALDFGGTVVPPGTYTLWSVPSPGGWKLLVNDQTGQWGTEHHPDRDRYTIDLATSPLQREVERFTITIVPEGAGGAIQLDWDTTRATARFAVK